MHKAKYFSLYMKNSTLLKFTFNISFSFQRYGQKIMYLTALATLLAITVTTICRLCQLGVNCVSYSPLEGNSDACDA